MNEVRRVTGFEAGLSGDEQIRIALQRMIERGGEVQMTDIYDAVEDRLRPTACGLSDQGRASLRFFVNRVAVQAGYVYPHDRAHPGWRITPEGREFVASPAATGEVAVNVDTGVEERVAPNSAQAAAFERWVILLLTQGEWLKFLAGCFARRVESAMFITTGRLTGEQRREAQEAKVIVIEGTSEILRPARLHNVEPFELVESGADVESG